MRKKSIDSPSVGPGEFRRSVSKVWIATLILTSMVLFSSTWAVAQTITSNGTGGGLWSVAATWSGGVVPDSTNCTQVIIASGDSVATNPTGLVSCNSIDIQSGAKLNVLGSTTGSGIRVKGTFTIEANAWFYNGCSSLTGWPNNAAGYTIDPQSNYVLLSGGSSSLGSNSADSTFGNVYDFKSACTCGANLTINGNLVMNTGASGNTLRGMGLADAQKGIYSLVHHVKGNVDVITGQWSCVDYDTAGGTMMCTWNVDGNVTVGDTAATLNTMARMGPFSSASTLGNSRIGIFSVGGNLTFINGGRLQAGTSSTAPSTGEVGEINLKGNLTLDKTAKVAGNSSGIFAFNFVGTKQQTVSLGVPIGYTPNSGGYFPTPTDTIASGATVVFTGGRPWGGAKAPDSAAHGWGQWVVNGNLMLSPTDSLIGTKAFYLNNSATLGIGSVDGITAGTAVGDTVGNILVTGKRTFSTGANYVYDGSSTQVTGDGLPATVNDLTIDNADTVTLFQSTTINGTLYLVAGIFDNTIPFTLGPNGKISITGGKLLVPTAINPVSSNLPEQFSLAQNFPNPFNPTTEIRFAIPVSGFVTLKVYDVLGRQVATLVNERKAPGVYEVTFDGNSLASGVYLYQVRSGNYISTKRMMLIK